MKTCSEGDLPNRRHSFRVYTRVKNFQTNSKVVITFQHFEKQNTGDH